MCGTSRRADRQANRSGLRSARRNLGPAGISGVFGRAEKCSRQALEDRGRPDSLGLGSKGRTGRDQPARSTARFFDHAGKVNPVIPELVNVVAFRVIGNDYTVSLAADHGQLQLNAYEPIEGLAILESQLLLYRASDALRSKCVDGITVNEKMLQHYMETTVGIVTALNPIIGYEKATELAAEAYESNKGVLQIIREKHILTEQQINELLDPVKLTGLDTSKYSKEK